MQTSNDLYKKYRPKTFDEVIGQDEIVESLRKSVLTKKAPTGFLFSGRPGTGKTTCALIYAKALNCDHIDERGNPCNECESCKSIDEDSNLGVHYIPMANNGSVDMVRQIAEDAKISQPVKQQVFILDEVQNLSKAAFDAFLKPLEADNMKSIFIFCTTEQDKIRPATLSRLQIRNFKNVDYKTLGNHIIKIAMAEGWYKKGDSGSKLTPQVLKDILSISEGSVRNAIGNLESYISTGVLNTSKTNALIECIVKRKLVDILKISETMSNEGYSYVKATEDLYKVLLNSLLVSSKNANKTEEYIQKNISKGEIVKFLDIIGDNIRYMTNTAVDYKIIFETTVMKIIINRKK